MFYRVLEDCVQNIDYFPATHTLSGIFVYMCNHWLPIDNIGYNPLLV
jgi:hypothetical protein